MMMFNPPPKGGQAYEGWRGIYYQGLCPWLPKCNPHGVRKDEIMHFSAKVSLGARCCLLFETLIPF